MGPDTVSFIEFVKIFKGKNKIKIKNVNLEQAYYDALHNSNSVYGVDDLNIMVGDFLGSHKKLKRISNFEFKTFRDVLQSSRLS